VQDASNLHHRTKGFSADFLGTCTVQVGGRKIETDSLFEGRPVVMPPRRRRRGHKIAASLASWKRLVVGYQNGDLNSCSALKTVSYLWWSLTPGGDDSSEGCQCSTWRSVKGSLNSDLLLCTVPGAKFSLGGRVVLKWRSRVSSQASLVDRISLRKYLYINNKLEVRGCVKDG
jgi:hypothetical protein